MTVRKWPLALNQPGYDYPAEVFRAQHYGASAGGNGVVDPGALKVVAQPAPDGTVSVVPGGAYAKSTYAGAAGQSYYVPSFEPEVLTIPPTGSASGGRHDLVILRVCDPQYDVHPEQPGGEITAEEAANYDFWWFEIHQGKPATATFDFPFVRLAGINRPANTTIVAPEHITDLRELANPQNHLHMRGNNLISDDRQSLHSGTTIWPNDATHYMKIPEFATNVVIRGSWETVAANRENRSQGTAVIALVHPDGSEIKTQQTRWRNVRDGDSTRDESLNIHNSDSRPVPAKFRGETVRVEMRATKISGPNVYMDGNSSWAVTLYFEQEIA